MKPFERKTQIGKMRRGFIVNNAYTEAFGQSVAPQLMSIQGRILPVPSVCVDCDGSWNFANRRVRCGVKVTAIGVLVLANPCFFAEDKIRGHMDAIAHTSEPMGLSFDDARCMNDSPSSTRESPQDIGCALPAFATAVQQQQFGKPADFLVVILGRKSVDTYAEIKRIGDTAIGIPAQCLVSNKVDRTNEQYWANMALKVNNVKLPQNAFNFHVNGSFKFLTPQVPGSLYLPSCHIRDIASATTRASRSGLFVFYRDGVSGGQFQTVSQTEIQFTQEVLLANASVTKAKLVIFFFL
ncbi:hypothetical protein BC828DRAFT_108392 [Blastocladiella britannica]|nr:hypothetical protein BC828DRAFT_108392 [Blastocladiella britannica]